MSLGYIALLKANVERDRFGHLPF